MLVVGGRAGAKEVAVVEDADAAAAVLGNKPAVRVVGDLDCRSVGVGGVEDTCRRACLVGRLERVRARGGQLGGRSAVKDDGKVDIDIGVACRVEGWGRSLR